MAYLLFTAVFLIEPLFMSVPYSDGLDISFGHALLAGFVAVITSLLVDYRSANKY